MSLDSRWVDEIHARLAVRYGTRWAGMWAGLPMEAVKADWASMLAGFGGHSIRHALDNLPEDNPPTAAQFRRLCINAPRPNEHLLRIAQKGDPMPAAVREKLAPFLKAARIQRGEAA